MLRRIRSAFHAGMGDSLAPLQHRAFRLFWLARLISAFGSWMAPIAVSFAVLDLTGEASDLGIVLAARTIPLLVLLLYGGVVADRLSRSRVLVWSNGVAAASQGAAALLLATGAAEVWHLAAIEAINGAGSAFSMPAGAGLTPKLVPASMLTSANALASMTGNVIRIIGLAVGGVIVATLGSATALAIDAATFAAAAALCTMLGLPAEARVRLQGTWAELVEGWEEFRARRWVWVIVAGFVVVNMAVGGAWYTLGPVVADASIGRSWWGVVLAANALGALSGTLLMARRPPARPLYAGVVGTLTCSVVYLVLAVVPAVVLLVPASFAMGFAGGVFGVAWYTALQTHIPDERLSRVISQDSFWSFVAIPLGQLAAGSAASQIGPTLPLLIAAVFSALATVAMVTNPDVRAVDMGLRTSPVARRTS